MISKFSLNFFGTSVRDPERVGSSSLYETTHSQISERKSMKKYKLTATGHGVLILQNERTVRCPVVIDNITKYELDGLKVQLNFKGISFIVEELGEDEEPKQKIPTVSKKVIVEELFSSEPEIDEGKDGSFLDKLLSEEGK